MTERNQMIEQKRHPLFVVGGDGVDLFQMVRVCIDAQQRNGIFLSPAPFQSVFHDNGDCRIGIVFFEQVKVADPDCFNAVSGEVDKRGKRFNHGRTGDIFKFVLHKTSSVPDKIA